LLLLETDYNLSENRIALSGLSRIE